MPWSFKRVLSHRTPCDETWRTSGISLKRTGPEEVHKDLDNIFAGDQKVSKFPLIKFRARVCKPSWPRGEQSAVDPRDISCVRKKGELGMRRKAL